MIWFLFVIFVFGIVFGALARLIVPGRDPMSIRATWALGVCGSLFGGFLGYVLFGADIEDGAVQAGGIFGSIVGSVLLLVIVRLVRNNRRTA